MEFLQSTIGWFDQLKGFLLFIVGLGGAILAIKKWVNEPIEKSDEKMDKILEQTNEKMDKILNESRVNDREMAERLDQLEGLISRCNKSDAMLLWDRLQSLHDEYMQKGYCPAVVKRRILQLFNRYHNELGLNTLSEQYEADFLKLPEHKKGVKGYDDEEEALED